MAALTVEQWRLYEEQGYLRLGKVLSDDELAALANRINDIMLGKADIDYTRLMMQREVGEGYEQSAQTLGFKGSTLNYRKVEQLEIDPIYLNYIQKPLFREICEVVYGADARISSYRAMFMNKPAFHGSRLQYHQDRWTSLNKDPLVTVWTALDPATKENGCVKVFPGTHKSLYNPNHPSGFLTPEQEKHIIETRVPVLLELEPGEAVLLHNWTVHGSEGNSSSKARRAFSVCYMEADTVKNADDDDAFPVVFGSGELRSC